MFLVSALPVFWAISIAGIPFRILIWFLTIPVVWTHRLLGSGDFQMSGAKDGSGGQGTSSQGLPNLLRLVPSRFWAFRRIGPES